MKCMNLFARKNLGFNEKFLKQLVTLFYWLLFQKFIENYLDFFEKNINSL
jgi:hypothetical protein